MQIEAVNLDCLPEDELRELANAYQKLMRYADYKLAAIKARKSANIGAAYYYERQCEVIYDTLPEELRW